MIEIAEIYKQSGDIVRARSQYRNIHSIERFNAEDDFTALTQSQITYAQHLLELAQFARSYGFSSTNLLISMYDEAQDNYQEAARNLQLNSDQSAPYINALNKVFNVTFHNKTRYSATEE